MLDESEDEILTKVSSIFSQKKSIFNFGSCAERKTFFEQTVPSRFGIAHPHSNANPNLGPGTYTNDYKTLDFDLRSSCNKKTGWSTSKRDFYKLNYNPGPANYQIERSSNDIVNQNRYPFNIKCPRTLPESFQGKDSPSVGTYELPQSIKKIDLQRNTYLKPSTIHSASCERTAYSNKDKQLTYNEEKKFQRLHPLYSVFAIAETDISSGSIIIVNYPSFKSKHIGKIKNSQVRHLKFSNQNLLACISSIPDNSLTIWDFVNNKVLIESSLNSVCPDIFDFCAVNENKLVGTTEKFVYLQE
nr:hypothetical transcript [Hymenolepis microstoma]